MLKKYKETSILLFFNLKGITFIQINFYGTE